MPKTLPSPQAPSFRRRLAPVAGSLLFGTAAAPLLAAPPDFNSEIRPLLADRCFACHGPDEHERKAGLRLDTYDGATADRDGVRAIDPDDLTGSPLLARVRHGDPDEVMPPPESGKSLSPAEIGLIRRWIEAGAPYQDHWAFVTPSQPEPPPLPGGAVARNPIDHFVAAKLAGHGLAMEPEADLTTLARRAALDLTGLPLDDGELARLAADRAPGAYERLVDRLLDSPRFGEHRARFWLDAVRYGDTHGLHLDNYREFYPYRDWVISAFNRNLPLDRFVTEQLAGDLLGNPTLDQQVATGFNRAHVTTSEGGSIAEEVFVRNVMDRTDTFSTVFLGLTANCASCHNHKYDPLSQRDYYSLFAYFNSLDADPLDGNKKDHAPVVRVPSAEQEEHAAAVRNRIASAREQVRQVVASHRYVEPDRPAERPRPELTEFVWVDDGVPPGARAEGPWDFASPGDAPVHSGEKSHRQSSDGLGQHFFTGAANPLDVAPGDRLFTYVYLDPSNPPEEIMLQWNDGDWNHRAYWGANKIDWGTDGTASRLHRGELPPAGKWVRLEVDAAAVGIKPGAKINGWAFTQFGGTVHWDRAGIVTTQAQHRYFDSFLEWTRYQASLEESTLPEDLAATAKQIAGGAELPDSARRPLLDHFVEHAFSGTREEIDPLHQQIADLEGELDALQKSVATSLVWKELDQPRDAFVLERGEYDRRGEPVGRAVPGFLPPLPEGAPNDRLGLAQWLLSPDHPLFARVAVNRFWQELFGTGLVKTAEDFGLQGEPPSHPALLDWLAVTFRESGWDTKALFKTIVTSAAYRQSSRVTPEKLEADPRNRLLSRGPRFRLDAETLRDQALAVSGLLVEKVGGPPVKPPQPDGLWKAVGYSGSNTVKFTADSGPDKVHRRSIYTFWKRTAPPPQMSILDAPSREACTVRRERTNTPLQALLLMNDPQYFEAARHLGQRAITEGGSDDRERVGFLFQTTLGRSPTSTELEILLEAGHDHRQEFAASPDRARATVSVGEFPPPDDATDTHIADLATFTMLANLVLNLDEVLTKN